MIVSKPKINTLFSLGVFIAISLLIGGYGLSNMLYNEVILWYHYVCTILFLPIGLGLLARLVIGYRIVKVGKQKFEISYPTQFKNRAYKISDLISWKETSVKTVSGNFKELEIKFNDKRNLKLSIQEHTEYLALIKYLNKKCPKLKSNA